MNSNFPFLSAARERLCKNQCATTNKTHYFIMKNKYVELAKAGTTYAKNMNRLSNRIFGEVTKDTNSKSMKVVKLFSEEPVYKQSLYINYYPRHNETYDLMKNLRLYGLYRDEHEDFKEEYQRLRELRGKKKWIPPKFRK